MKKAVMVLFVLIFGLAMCGCEGLDPNCQIDLCNKVIQKPSNDTWFRYVNGNIVEFKVMTDSNTLSHANTAIKSFSDMGEILAVKYQDEVYVIVAKPVMKTGEYIVLIEEMKKGKNSYGLSLRISAKYIKTNPNETTSQIQWYPFSIVKTDLKELPDIIEVYWMENETPSLCQGTVRDH